MKGKEAGVLSRIPDPPKGEYRERVSTSSCLQVIGLACIPVNDIPDEHPVLARRPVAAAVLTMAGQDGGYCGVSAICVSDARKSEIPLPHLLDKTLLPGVAQIASAADRATLAMDAMSRRFFVEPALAKLCSGEEAIDPAAMGEQGFDERTACRRFSIPMPEIDDADIELAWSRSAPAAAEDHALRVATARLMLWAHVEAFRSARPEPSSRPCWPCATGSMPASI